MLIEQEQNGHKGMFYIGDVTDPQAAMTYTMAAPDKMIIDHTEVSDALRGKNVGLQLVHFAVGYARTNNIKIIPLCPFARSVFKKKTEFEDVLVKYS